MEFRILGRLEVRDGDREVAITGAKRRALLAVLLLRANELVATEPLVHEVWPQPPASATKLVQVHVSQLRKLVGAGAVETRGPGYLLRVAPDAIDLHRFERLLADGRSLLADGSTAAAKSALDAALALWRGPALAEFRYEPFAQAAIARLEELRLVALELQIDAKIQLGLHAEAVPELEALVREYPLRESLRALLMLALYRSDRQADALAVYQEAHRTLADELGLAPGRRLKELEREILRQDAPADADAASVTRYARSGEINIAYQVVGDGPYDVVYVPGAFSHVELTWTIPSRAAFLRRLASFGRTIIFDKRGTGMSDHVGVADLETRMDDVRAVMDAARSQRAALLGVSEGGPMSILFAATYPERTWALVLFASFPRESWAPDYPFGMTAEEYEQLMRQMTEPEFYERLAAELAPSADALSKRRFADMMRQSGGVRARLELMQMNRELDVRHVLGAIRVPTLVLCSAEDDRTNVAGSRYLAEHIAGARYVELPGVDHAPGGQNADAVLAEIAAFLNDAWDAAQQAPVHDRVLTTVLAVAVGAQHRDAARRELARFRGAEIRTDGDGLVARFDGPARAVRCANAILAALRSLGVDARAGLHTGECQIADGVYSGDAVAAAATVAARAAEGQVLVSAAVRDLLAGSDIAFAEAGMAVLGEPPTETQLWRAAGEAQRAAGG